MINSFDLYMHAFRSSKAHNQHNKNNRKINLVLKYGTNRNIDTIIHTSNI